MKKIILASQSVQRRLLMETLGLPFEVMPTHVDEKAIFARAEGMRSKEALNQKANMKALTLLLMSSNWI